MKAKEIIRAVEFGLIIIVVAALFSGCSTQYQAYRGPTLPREQVAVLKSGNGFCGEIAQGACWISYVDSSQLPAAYREIKLLPGKHTITFQFLESRSYSTGYMTTFTGTTSKDVDVEAGKTYIFVPDAATGAHTWDVEITEKQ
jgi:hypothetical protein